ncbi:MAG TPA: 3-dehydroquinate synthase II [Candidatus Bathyarchaeota archaeon]|nr:3-dehydroquinate synthase II [Candidatus Bathyarchaeota archaeon]
MVKDSMEVWLNYTSNLPKNIDWNRFDKVFSHSSLDAPIPRVAPKGEVELGVEALEITIEKPEDAEVANKAISEGIRYLIVDCKNWKIIPWENLIAYSRRSGTKVIAVVRSRDEACTASQTLEVGVDGVLLTSLPLEVAYSIADSLHSGKPPHIQLLEAEVTEVRPVGMGLRACVDTCDLMVEGEGMLVGSSSSLLFLVEAEVHESGFVAPRPFRVNAGAISQYILMPGEKTNYLSELKSGDTCLIINRDGGVKYSVVGRVKIERRPLLYVEARCEDVGGRIILQDAETIRLVTPDGSKSVKELKQGDKLLVFVSRGGRHFGVMVSDEYIEEK